MLFKSTLSQTIFLLRQKITVFVFYVLLAIVLLNFITNVFTFQGTDVTRMYQPMRLLTLSYDKVNYSATITLLLVQLYPLLVVCPAGFSLSKENQTRENVLMIARLGNPTYKLSKLFAGFFATAIIFLVPFLLEILLNALSFPLDATGNLSNLRIYDSSYLQGVQNYIFSEIYLYSPYLYAVFGTFFWSVVSGIIGAFSVAISSVIPTTYRVVLFLPVFLLLNFTVYFPMIYGDTYLRPEWFNYLFLFNDMPKNTLLFAIVLIIISCSSIGIIMWSGRKDCL